jgi:hypothetical protein
VGKIAVGYRIFVRGSRKRAINGDSDGSLPPSGGESTDFLAFGDGIIDAAAPVTTAFRCNEPGHLNTHFERTSQTQQAVIRDAAVALVS